MEGVVSVAGLMGKRVGVGYVGKAVTGTALRLSGVDTGSAGSGEDVDSGVSVGVKVSVGALLRIFRSEMSTSCEEPS